MQSSHPSNGSLTLASVRRAALTALILLAMPACAADRTVVQPAEVAVSETQSASASVGRANVTLLDEPTPESILWSVAQQPGADPRYVINNAGLANRLQEVYGDIGEVDFLIVLPTKPLITSMSSVTNRDISGIGVCNNCTFAPMPQLKNIASMAVHEPWQIATADGFDPAVYFNGFMSSIMHELGHYWLMSIENFGNGYPGHYQNTLDLFYGDSTFADPMAVAHWIVNGSSEICVKQGREGTTDRFSDLSLYLMGLIPPKEVAPVTQHIFRPMNVDPGYNNAGPICGQPYEFTGQRVVSIEDIIALHGARSPSHLQSQKDFRAMFIVLHPADEAPSKGFVKYASALADSLPAAWASATRGLSTIKVVPFVPTQALP
jgi:hypothetical protein